MNRMINELYDVILTCDFAQAWLERGRHRHGTQRAVRQNPRTLVVSFTARPPAANPELCFLNPNPNPNPNLNLNLRPFRAKATEIKIKKGKPKKVKCAHHSPAFGRFPLTPSRSGRLSS